MSEVSHLSPLPSHVSARKCLVTGEALDKSALLRFVRAPDGTLTFDLHHKLPGRGAYVTADTSSLRTAISKNLFAKSFKDKTIIPPALPAQIISQIKNQALQTLALARRAGEAITGHEKVQDAILRGQAAFLVMATDAGADAVNKARQAARDLPILAHFDRDALGAIFGRDQAVWVAVASGGLADKFLWATGRLLSLIHI
jgi:predicted RNA-binding protein YlxR (DUF448 family)